MGVMFVFSNKAKSQLLLNQDFENYTTCPTAGNQVSLAVPWVSFSGSVDYVNCGYTSWGATASSGTGCMLSFHNASFSGPTAGFLNPEYISSPLTVPLIPGNTYYVSWDLNNIQNPACADFGMLFYNSATPPTVGAFGLVGTPQVLVPQASIPANSYATFTHTFVATAAHNRVVIGPFWNGGPCAGYTKIILFDNMSVSPNPPLPIDLVSFEGEKMSNSNMLKWVTSSEINNSYFTVEKSKDGKVFEILGTVEGAGNSSVQLSYNMLDSKPHLVTYYRLKQTDYDGKYKYSKIISVSNSGVEDLKLYPNPVKDKLTISSKKNIQKIEVLDISGKKVRLEKVTDNVIDISTLSKGIYIARVTFQSTVVLEKFIKE